MRFVKCVAFLPHTKDEFVRRSVDFHISWVACIPYQITSGDFALTRGRAIHLLSQIDKCRAEGLSLRESCHEVTERVHRRTSRGQSHQRWFGEGTPQSPMVAPTVVRGCSLLRSYKVYIMPLFLLVLLVSYFYISYSYYPL